MVEAELTHELVSRLERLGLDYFITGSVATAAYGPYRSTLDIDVVVLIRSGQIGAFCGAFAKPQFWVDDYSVRLAVESDGMFTMIYEPSGEKVDVILPVDSDFNESRFERRRRIELPSGVTASVACPEHVILSKMDFYRQGGSEKHLSDITGMLQLQAVEIERPYVERMAYKMGTIEIWHAILAKLRDAGYE